MPDMLSSGYWVPSTNGMAWISQGIGLTPGGVQSPGGNSWYVPSGGSINSTLANAANGDTIYVPPGAYNEAVVVSKMVRLVGLGTVTIAPSTAVVGLTLATRHITLENINVASGDGASAGLVVTGDSYTILGGKFETQNGGVAIHMKPGASSGLSASQGVLDGIQVCWCDTGIQFDQCSQGFVTQCAIRDSRFHNCATAALGEASAGMTRNLTVLRCVFERMEDGTEPTAYINLGTDNTGMVSQCSFPSALAGGKNTVPTSVIWSANFMSGGISTGQPS